MASNETIQFNTAEEIEEFIQGPLQELLNNSDMTQTQQDTFVNDFQHYLEQNLGRPMQIEFIQGLSETAVDAIPEVDMHEVSLSDQDQCSVCLSGFEASQTSLRLPCGHIFHKDCVSTWLQQINSCPLCRASVEIVVEGS